MINTKQGVWLLGILGFIIVILLCILFFVPAKPTGNNVVQKTEGIEIISPNLNEPISSPLKITGVVNGNGWSGFEGQVGTVELVNSEGTTIITTILKATSDWMKAPTNFEAILDFSGYEGDAILLFHNENPSGIPEKDKTYILPVKILKSKTISVGVFFGNQALSASSEQDECKRVYKSNRYIGETVAVAEAAIDELLKAPTEQEKNQGFFTNIPVGSKLNSISIVNGVAKADFNETTESGGGSCSMAARVAQINQTLKQFSTVSSVTLSVNGKTEAIFQP